MRMVPILPLVAGAASFTFCGFHPHYYTLNNVNYEANFRDVKPADGATAYVVTIGHASW